MRVFLFCFVLMLISLSANAQRVTEFTVEPGDVQIRFPGAAEPGAGEWRDVEFVGTVTYSTEPLGSHRSRAKLGLQNWEFELQPDAGVYEKAMFTILVASMPYGFRLMGLQVRVTEVVDGVTYKAPWSNPGQLKIIWRPRRPFHIGR